MSAISQQLETLVRSAKRKAPGERVIGVRVPRMDDLPVDIEVEGEKWPVRGVHSPLQARRALVEAGRDGRILLVTDLEHGELGLEIQSRLASRKLQELHPWQIVRDAFSARRLDPRVVKEGAWVARELMADVPSTGYRPVSSGLLDLDTVWGVLHKKLGLKGARPGLADYLSASAEGELGTRWGDAAEDLRRGAAKRMQFAGKALRQDLVAVLDADYAAMVVPLGLVLALVVDEETAGQPAVLQARTRLERYGIHAAEPAVLEPWVQEASRWARRALSGGGEQAQVARDQIARAERIVTDIKAEVLLGSSDVLAGGFEARCEELAHELNSAANGTAWDQARARAAFRRLEKHLLVEAEPTYRSRVARAGAALRLAQWLATSDSHANESVAACAVRYQHDSAYADSARLLVGRGEPEGPLRSAYGGLLEAARTRREAENQAFAGRLARAMSGQEGWGEILPIEQAFERVVAPVAERVPALVVVMDGMAEWVAQRILEDIGQRARYQRMSPENQDRLPPMVGLLPSVTEVCRTSLLCGERIVGGQQDEVAGIEAMAERFGWRGRTKTQQLLFHKGELTVEHGALSPAVRAALEGSARVVVVVVNAVDDSLAGGDQLQIDWRLSAVPVLDELVQAASAVGRAIVLTADHGHVVDARGSSMLDSDGNAGRWRPGGEPAEALEIRVEGDRVLLPSPGGPCVVPWSERARYVRPQAGYHGGATPQEVVTPLAVLVPDAQIDAMEGWSAEVVEQPAWWALGEEEVSHEVDAEAPQSSPAPRPQPRRAPETEGTPSLFPDPEPVEMPPSAGQSERDWVDQLFEAPLWVPQRAYAGRTPPKDEDVARVLRALDVAGGKISIGGLQNRTRVPAPRLRGLLTAMGRMLNVDGYPVLEVDFGDGEVSLDRALLRTQFSLGSGGQPS